MCIFFFGAEVHACMGLCVNGWLGLTMSRVWLPSTSVSRPKLAEIQPQTSLRCQQDRLSSNLHVVFCQRDVTSEMRSPWTLLVVRMSYTKFGSFVDEFVWPARFSSRLCIRTLSLCCVSLHAIQWPLLIQTRNSTACVEHVMQTPW